MPAGPVALVSSEAVAREVGVHLVADAVTGNFGHDGGGGNGRRDRVAVNDRALRVRRLADGQRIDEQVMGFDENGKEIVRVPLREPAQIRQAFDAARGVARTNIS